MATISSTTLAQMGTNQNKSMMIQAKEVEETITITLADGKQLDGKAGITTPMEIAKNISASLAKQVIIAKIDNEQLWDLNRPLKKSCSMQLLDFQSEEGKNTFWHSSAHLLGQAIELEFANEEPKLCIGPALQDGGFYYDVKLKETKFTDAHYKAIENKVSNIIKEKQPFERLELKKDEALDLFADNPFKVEIILKKVPDGETCTAYRCGPLIDLCRGPHVPNSGVVAAMAVTKHGSSYWLGKAENAPLQRMYGITFPDKKQLKEHMDFLKAAEERDHRKVGLHQKLFFFHEWSPGSAFFLPHGTRIYNTLMNFIRKQYWKRGYEEVISPNIFNLELWKRSGHYDNYKENMFLFDVEKSDFGMKPMNCPGHCLMFASTARSYRELPLRLADFGVLHRNEFSGALTGLTRVRRFQQDDAHIFCTPDQIEQEVAGVLDMLQEVYGVFGFQFDLKLSTRPEKYLGDLAVWDKAEAALSSTLDKYFPKGWNLNPGDGAFYGPKIDIQLTDALKRKHQCATIQLDFQLPVRFKLEYNDGSDVLKQPVIIHRAVLGSVERMIAVLIEHTGGKWPFWISPRQVMVIPVGEKYIPYAEEVRQLVHDAGFFADVDTSGRQLPKKVREAQLSQYNLMFVVGEKELAHRTVNIRFRDNNTQQEERTLEDALAYMVDLRDRHH